MNKNDKILFCEKEVSRMLGVSTRKLQKDRQRNVGLPYVKLGGAVRYSKAEILAHIEENKVVPAVSGNGGLQ